MLHPSQTRPFSRLRRSTLVLAVFATAAILAPGIVTATTMRQLDTRDLTLSSPTIVIGRVESVRSHWDDRRVRILTEVEFEIGHSLKGPPGTRITLTQLGGEVDGVRYTVPGAPSFQVGEEALLFVWHDAGGRRQVNGLAQGKFDIRRDPATGLGTVQRTVPGFAVGDTRNLTLAAAGRKPPLLRLDDLVREIQAVLASEGK